MKKVLISLLLLIYLMAIWLPQPKAKAFTPVIGAIGEVIAGQVAKNQIKAAAAAAATRAGIKYAGPAAAVAGAEYWASHSQYAGPFAEAYNNAVPSGTPGWLKMTVSSVLMVDLLDALYTLSEPTLVKVAWNTYTPPTGAVTKSITTSFGSISFGDYNNPMNAVFAKKGTEYADLINIQTGNKITGYSKDYNFEIEKRLRQYSTTIYEMHVHVTNSYGFNAYSQIPFNWYNFQSINDITVGPKTIESSPPKAISYNIDPAVSAAIDAGQPVEVLVPDASNFPSDQTASVDWDNTYKSLVDPAAVTPKAADPTITIKNPTITLDLDQTKTGQLLVELNPAGELSYASSNTGVATIDTAGTITAVGVGTAVITATAVANPAITATATVTVSALPAAESGIKWTPLKTAGGLFTTKFPFSIPWDVKNQFAVFNVTPKSPVLKVDKEIPVFNTSIKLKFDIDFRMFDPVATIARWFMIIAFDLGLILSIRKFMPE